MKITIKYRQCGHDIFANAYDEQGRFVRCKLGDTCEAAKAKLLEDFMLFPPNKVILPDEQVEI